MSSVKSKRGFTDARENAMFAPFAEPFAVASVCDLRIRLGGTNVVSPWMIAGRTTELACEWRRSFFRRKSTAASTVETDAAEITVRSKKLGRLEAVFFLSDGATSIRRLTQLAVLADTAETHSLIERLNEAYDAEESPFRIERVGAGFQLLTRSPYAVWLSRIHNQRTQWKLSPPALETLTIIAYRQPVKRVDVEAIRGVQSAEIIRQLMERGLIRIGGEEDSLGRPYLYETTRQFLESFGLLHLHDLPLAETLRQPPVESSVETTVETSAETVQKTVPEQAVPDNTDKAA